MASYLGVAYGAVLMIPDPASGSYSAEEDTKGALMPWLVGLVGLVGL